MRLALLISAVLALVAPAAAQAAVDFSPCGGRVECGTVEAPLDRSGQVPGTVALHVERVRARRGATKPPVVALIGGPGKPDTNYTRDYVELFGRALDERDLIVFDNRGTGDSDPIGCAGIQLGQGPQQAMPGCRQELGPKAHLYTTVQNADDLDSVRAALGAPRVAVFARAYGGFEAQVFARRHPQRVESLILDSTLSQGAIDDGLEVRIFRGLPGAARRYCARGSCRGITRDLWADGVKLYDRLQRKPLTARLYDGDGARTTRRIDAVSFALLFFFSFVHAEQRAELPRAIAMALRGDGAVLARLLAIDANAPYDPKRGQNDTVNLLTQCEEVDYRFDRTASPQQRLQQSRASLDQVPASVFEPFGRDLAFLNSQAPICAHWPMRPQRPSFGGALPDVPALLFHGEQDLRATRGETAEVASALPRSTVLEVPQTAHAVWITDVTGCVRRNVRAFLRGRAVGRRCRPVRRSPYAPRRIPRKSARGLEGRGLVRAVADSVADGFNQLDDAARRVASARRQARIGGLRGGSLRGRRDGALFVRYRYLRRLAVSGRVRRRGPVRLRIRGAVRGRLTFRANGTVRGRLAGKRVRTRMRLVRETPYESLRRRGLVPG
jgi:pimeloyl-ACP methyl ester carboxylesterase